MKDCIGEIEKLLIKHLDPTKLIIEDTTEKHKDHKGFNPSKIHLKIQIECPLFNEKSKLEQHRIVMDLLKPHFKNVVHSVSLQTQTSKD